MKKLIVLVGAMAAVALLALAVIVPAFAEGPTPTPTPTPGPKAPFGFFGRGMGFWGGSWTVFDAVAKALGLTPEQLFAELRAGKTLTQIAEAKGVKLETIQEAIKAAQIEAMKQSIQQAVKDGKLTQAQADWLLKGLELGFLPGRGGFGRGWGKGFFPMRGWLGQGSGQSGQSVVPSKA